MKLEIEETLKYYKSRLTLFRAMLIEHPKSQEVKLNCERLQTVVDAFEKQVGQEIIVRGLGQRYCPTCGHGNQKGLYCQNCGQLLKWPEVKK